jgi:hypothetical protein
MLRSSLHERPETLVAMASRREGSGVTSVLIIPRLQGGSCADPTPATTEVAQVAVEKVEDCKAAFFPLRAHLKFEDALSPV